MNDFEERLNEALRPSRVLRPVRVGRQTLDQYREAATRFGRGLQQLIKIHPEMRSKIKKLLDRLNQEIGRNLLEQEEEQQFKYEDIKIQIEDAYYDMMTSIPRDLHALRRKLQLIHRDLIKDVYGSLGMTYKPEEWFADAMTTGVGTVGDAEPYVRL